MTDLDLEPIKARERAATPGDWWYVRAKPGRDPDCGICAPDCANVLAETYAEFVSRGDYRPEQAVANAEFIAHARTDVPALISALEEARLRAAEAAERAAKAEGELADLKQHWERARQAQKELNDWTYEHRSSDGYSW